MAVKSLFTVIFVIVIGLVKSKLVLEQVVIFNRHGLRVPLAKDLKDLSPKAWPLWEKEPGFLTAKGARLAGYMGKYVAAWLKKEGILPTTCPCEDDLYVISNSKERTLTSAQSFIENGFPDCNINVPQADINDSNYLFNPIIHNTSATFKEQALEEMYEVINAVNLTHTYDLISKILDYKQSRSYEMNNKYDLTLGKHDISIIPGLKPQLSGPLKIGNDAIDAFLMQYYEGFQPEDIAWGQLMDSNSWQKVFELTEAYFSIKYKTRLVARDIAGPLIKYMADVLTKNDNSPKVTLLVGHDVNIHTIFKTLLVTPYTLENQIEIIPIGSAVIFQKWKDDELQKNYLKLSFVYQSTEQLRNGSNLSLDSPPYVKTLELEKCIVDKNGFCPWDDFKTFLDSI